MGYKVPWGSRKGNVTFGKAVERGFEVQRVSGR